MDLIQIDAEINGLEAPNEINLFKKTSPCLVIYMHGGTLDLAPIKPVPEIKMTRFKFASTGLANWTERGAIKPIIDEYIETYKYFKLNTCDKFFLYIKKIFEYVVGFNPIALQQNMVDRSGKYERKRAAEYEAEFDDDKKFYPRQPIHVTNPFSEVCNATSYIDKMFEYVPEPPFKTGTGDHDLDKYDFGIGVYLLNEFEDIPTGTNIIQTDEFLNFLKAKYELANLDWTPVWSSSESGPEIHPTNIKLSDIIEFFQTNYGVDYLSWVDFSCDTCVERGPSSRDIRAASKITNVAGSRTKKRNKGVKRGNKRRNTKSKTIKNKKRRSLKTRQR